MNHNWALAFLLPSSVISLINKVSSTKFKIKDKFPEISQGLIAYDAHQGQSQEIIDNRVFHHKEYKNGLKVWLWGEDVKRYNYKWNGQEYVDYCQELANPRDPKFFKGKRILIREITSPYIYATLVTEELYHDPALIVLKDSGNYSSELLLGILNSKLATFYHFNHSPKATKGLFPKILVSDLNDFPIPEVSSKIVSQVETLVNDISRIKKLDENADVSKLENKIDLIVYHLYGLSYNEIVIIDPSFPLSEEEYINFKVEVFE